MKKVFVSLCMAATVAGLSSCASTKNAATLSSLSGEWNIIEINGSAVVPAPNQEFPFIGFDTKTGQVYGNSGCNRLMGSFDVNAKPGQIDLGALGSTRMMCPDMTLEQNVLEALNKVAGYETVGEDVALNDAEGKPVILLQKREVAEVSVNDLNGAWEIVSVKGNPVGEVEKQPQLVFNVAEKRVHGNASCNTINGSFTQEEGQAASLRFSQMISTMMACPNMDVESSILKALDEVRSFEIKADGTVSLLGADGAEVLSLKKLAETEAEA